MAGLPKIASYPLPQEHELPKPRGPWMLETARAALLVHDMQRYFVSAYQPDASPIAPAAESSRSTPTAAAISCCRMKSIAISAHQTVW